jgi:GLPGLI family protein
MTTYITMPQWMWNDNCYYEENIDLQQWEILEDTLTVCENLCQKATCTFRGRKYVAWFTMNIPISNGPWKFGGLPGLILKIYDTDNIYVFECVGIEYHKEKYIIRKWDYSEFKFTKGKRENTLKLIKKIHENFYQVSGLRNNDGTPLVWNPIPYHPLELE